MKRSPPPVLWAFTPSATCSPSSLSFALRLQDFTILHYCLKYLKWLLIEVRIPSTLHCRRNYHLPWSSHGALASQASFIFIFIWLFPLSELSLWQAFCICQVMPLEMSLWAQQQSPACILIAYLHNIQAVEKDHVFIINTRGHTPNDTLYILHCGTDYKALFLGSYAVLGT